MFLACLASKDLIKYYVPLLRPIFHILSVIQKGIFVQRTCVHCSINHLMHMIKNSGILWLLILLRCNDKRTETSNRRSLSPPRHLRQEVLFKDSMTVKQRNIFYFSARCNICSLLITFANRFDPDHVRQKVGPDLDRNCLTPCRNYCKISF